MARASTDAAEILGFSRRCVVIAVFQSSLCQEEESAPAALTDQLMVGRAQGGAAAAAADPAERVGELELQQQHVAIEGG